MLVTRAVLEGKIPAVEPYFDEKESSHDCQVAVCLIWAMLRLWTTLPDRPKGNAWDTKYSALDTAMRSFVVCWARPIAQSFVRLIDAEFDFSQVPQRYPPDHKSA